MTADRPRRTGAAVDPVDLVDLAAERLHVRQHELGGFRDLHRVHVEEALAGGDLLQHVVQQRVAAEPLVLRKDSRPVDDEPARPPVLQQQVDDPPRRDPSAGALQGGGQVGEAEQEAGDLPLVDQQLDQGGVGHRHEVGGDLADLLVAQGVELVPVGLEGIVVHAPDEAARRTRSRLVRSSGTSKLPRFMAISATRLTLSGTE